MELAPTQRVMGCGGKRSATPLSPAPRFTNLRQSSSAPKRCRRCALPPHSKTSRTIRVAGFFTQPASLVTLLGFILLHSTFILRAQGQSYSVDWHKIAGGGGTSTNGQFSVTGTIGQPDASSAMTNNQYSVTGGFWALPQAVQTLNAPTLTIAPAAPGNATISWTPSTPGFVLQEAPSVTGTWTNSPSGATNPITVPAAVPTKFYRLVKP